MYEADFSEFGYREIRIASKLLNAYLDSNDLDMPLSGLKVGFNENSGYVFLMDEDYNTYMMNGDKLEQFYSCPNCGNEGFKEEFKDYTEDCKDCRYIYSGNYEDSEDNIEDLEE